MNILFIFLLIITFFVFFTGLWMLICWVLSHLGGWHTLSKKYKSKQEPYGICVYMESMRIGLVSYSHTMTFCPSAEGLSMSVIRLFSIGHPPLLIPWDVFHNPRPSKLLWKKMVTVDVGSPIIKTLMLPEKAYYNRYNVLKLI